MQIFFFFNFRWFCFPIFNFSIFTSFDKRQGNILYVPDLIIDCLFFTTFAFYMLITDVNYIVFLYYTCKIVCQTCILIANVTFTQSEKMNKRNKIKVLQQCSIWSKIFFADLMLEFKDNLGFQIQAIAFSSDPPKIESSFFCLSSSKVVRTFKWVKAVKVCWFLFLWLVF